MNKQIHLTLNGKPLLAVSGITLSEIINGERPCGGHGRCGKCKVLAKGSLSAPTDSELSLLTPEELAHGVRLACLTHALGDCEIETLSKNTGENILTVGNMPELEIKPSFKRYGMAVDIGTTTIAAMLYGTDGRVLAEASAINPQQSWGADVISRIEASLDGKSGDLAASVRQAIDGIAVELADVADIATEDIDAAVMTGNTVMLSLLTEQSAEPFSHAPFEAERLFGETLLASELDLNSLRSDVPIYLPPCISAFVGADTVCAILATGLHETETAMLADIGTNGEMALIKDGRLTVCSTAAGPAFEGVGISMGMRGAEGAIDRVEVEGHRLSAHVIGDKDPVGICGSGLVDAVASMLELDIIDESGYLEDDEFIIQSPVSLTPKDIRMLQLAKSAICAGLATLMRHENVTEDEISTLYIAGGFGSYLGKDSAARIGLLPKRLALRSTAVGNAALAGASMLLLNVHEREIAHRLAKSAAVLDLSTDPFFSEAYMMGMTFEET